MSIDTHQFPSSSHVYSILTQSSIHKSVRNKNKNKNKNCKKFFKIFDFLNGPLCQSHLTNLVNSARSPRVLNRKFAEFTFRLVGYLNNLLIRSKILHIAVYSYFQNPWGKFNSLFEDKIWIHLISLLNFQGVIHILHISKQGWGV